MQVQRINYNDLDAPQRFTESLRHTGFGVLTNHPLTKNTISNLYENWETFFTAPRQQKESFRYDQATQMGWAPPEIAETAKGYDKRDIKEYFNYFTYGSCPESLRKVTDEVYQQLHQVAQVILTWIYDNTPEIIRADFSLPLPSMIENSSEILFRINYYPAFTGAEEIGAFRAAAHNDINLITVLTAGSNAGLQARDLNDNWHDIACEQGDLVINVGDMLQECSRGYYPSTLHRVLNPVDSAQNKARMSCPLFVHPRPEVVLSERHTQASYIHERLVELGFRKA
jgi:isopenicillin N synthase-like dioxygenase